MRPSAKRVAATVAVLALVAIAVAAAVNDAVYAMTALLVFEPVATARATWLSMTVRERDVFETPAPVTARPIVLLPGAAGTWRYLFPLALRMSASRNIAVVGLSPGGATEEDRARVKNMIEDLGECDVVSHSMGGFLAVEVACMPEVRRVVTLALPTEKGESTCMGKIRNVNALSDAIVGKRNSAVPFDVIRSGHLGIVYHREAPAKVLRMLE